MYVVKKKKGPENSRPCMKLVKIGKHYRRNMFGTITSIFDEYYEFHLIEQGVVVERMHAQDVYRLYPTHDTYEKFIQHWLSDQEVQTKSTLDLTCTFKQPKSSRIYPQEREADSDNNV